MKGAQQNSTLLFWQYIVLPLVFLLVTLLGGLRLSFDTGAFIFLAPTLFNLVLALLLAAAIFRGLVKVEEWFSPNFSVLKNCANAVVLLTLFAASVQALNCILPEKGLAFGLTAFFLLWTLWTNLFAELEATKMLRSLAALFGFAFVFKYVFLASLVSTDEGWMRTLAESFFDKVSLGLFQIPKFAAATGYVAFFTVLLFGAGLLLLYSLSNKTSPATSSDTTS